MTRRAPRVLTAALLATAVLAVGALLVPSPSPAAGSDGPCPGTTGVTVVVDYQALGGGLAVRCAPGSPDSGFKALLAAGFSIEEVRNVPGFLCRIDGEPGLSEEACLNTPPAGAYWSYWNASRGGTWKVSQEGAKTRTPPVGSVEGWSFSDDGTPGPASPPGIDPPAAPPTPKPATPKPVTPRPATARPATPDPATPTPPRPTDEPSISIPAATMPASPSIAATAAASPADPTQEAVGATTASQRPSPGDVALGGTAPGDDGGAGAVGGGAPPLGTLVGIGLLVAVVSGALLARSRRSSRRSP